MIRLGFLFALLISWQAVLAIGSAPRLGFDNHMQQKSDYDHLKESYDSQTGRRLPEIDTGRMRTWQFDPPEFLLPDEQQGRPDPIEPGGGRPELV